MHLRASRSFATLAAISLLALLHCGGTTAPIAGSDAGPNPPPGPNGPPQPPGVPSPPVVPTPETPIHHRPVAVACSATRPPGLNETGPTSYGCNNDAECTQGKNGRCTVLGGNAGPQCTYDDCVVDADCSGDSVCACGYELGTYGADAGAEPPRSGNTCMSGNCRVDADCGPGGYCSPSAVPGVPGEPAGAFAYCGDGSRGYFCHTTADECENDSDCGGGLCVYEATIGIWACDHAICAG